MIKPRFLIALLLVIAAVSAFTVTPNKATVMRPAMPVTTPVATSSTALSVQVDPAIGEMVANSSPIGAIIMMALAISFWELVTPGRAKKEG
jgi:hypothetical protein